MLPRCWLLRRSERLGHNQCHGLFILQVFLPLSIALQGRAVSKIAILQCSWSTRGEVEMKEQLASVVLQMYKAGFQCSAAVREFQRAFILIVLKDQRGNQCKAAEKLGVHRNTLRQRFMN